MSSPVSLAGAGNHSAKASSIGSPVARIAQAGEGGLARLRDFTGKGFERLAGARAGNAHDRDGRRRAATR